MQPLEQQPAFKTTPLSTGMSATKAATAATTTSYFLLRHHYFFNFPSFKFKCKKNKAAEDAATFSFLLLL